MTTKNQKVKSHIKKGTYIYNGEKCEICGERKIVETLTKQSEKEWGIQLKWCAYCGTAYQVEKVQDPLLKIKIHIPEYFKRLPRRE